MPGPVKEDIAALSDEEAPGEAAPPAQALVASDVKIQRKPSDLDITFDRGLSSLFGPCAHVRGAENR